MELDVRVDGDPAAPAVVLLHGFPQTPASWDQVVPRLVDAGHRTVVPTQRGYSATARPTGRRAYRIDELVGDVVEVIERVGAPVHLVGHDWGGGVAWALAARRPELLRTLTAVSTPHPAALIKAAVTSKQALMSWYIGLFQLPVVPEKALLADDAKRLRAVLRGLPPASIDTYVAAMQQPGALTAALNWYRALPLSGRGGPGRVSVPTLYVWGDRDPALGRTAAEHTRDFVTGRYKFVEVPGAGHWIPERHADALVAELLPHLQV